MLYGHLVATADTSAFSAATRAAQRICVEAAIVKDGYQQDNRDIDLLPYTVSLFKVFYFSRCLHTMRSD